MYTQYIHTCACACSVRICEFYLIFFGRLVTNRQRWWCTRVEVDHYNRNLTPSGKKKKKKRKMYVKNNFPPARGRPRPCRLRFVCVCAFRNRRRRESVPMCVCVCTPTIVCGSSGSGCSWRRPWWWRYPLFRTDFPTTRDLCFIYKLRTTAVSISLSVLTSFNSIQYNIVPKTLTWVL